MLIASMSTLRSARGPVCVLPYRSGSPRRRAQASKARLARKKRMAAAASGGMSKSPILMATNAPPQTAHSKTMSAAEKRSSGLSSDSNTSFALRLTPPHAHRHRRLEGRPLRAERVRPRGGPHLGGHGDRFQRPRPPRPHDLGHDRQGDLGRRLGPEIQPDRGVHAAKRLLRVPLPGQALDGRPGPPGAPDHAHVSGSSLEDGSKRSLIPGVPPRDHNHEGPLVDLDPFEDLHERADAYVVRSRKPLGVGEGAPIIDD